jgi:ABC-type sugar transport system permease subunit
MSFTMRTILRGPGVLNFFVTSLGLEPVQWLTNPFWAVAATSGFIVWQLTGQNMLVILAGLQGIPKTLYEAADIDGAKDRQKFFRITLPLLTPYIFFLVITNLIFTMQIFDQIYVLTRGGPGYATTTLVYFIVTSAFQEFNLGYASVLSVVLFLLLMTVTLIQWKTQDKWVFYG